MERSRRRFIAAGLLSSVSLAGCLSDDSGVPYPDGDADANAITTTSAQTTQTTKPADTTTEEPTTTTTPAPNPELGAATERIVAEAEWFATAYESTIDRYLALCDQAVATIQQVKRSSSFTENQQRKVREAATRAAEFTATHLRPHFDADGPVPGPLLDTIATFAKRGDLDRVDEELGNLLDHFKAVGNGYYVRTEFSKDPIEDRLFRRMAAPDDANVIFGFRLHGTGFEGWGYPHGENFERYRKLRYASAAPSFGDVFDPVAIPESRHGVVSLTVNRITDRVEWTRNSLPSVPVFVQTYRTPGEASAAREAAVSTAVTVEGSESFGRADWDQIYYYHDGDITYAYMLQAGRYLLAMSPSTTPWNERGDAGRKTLARSWLGRA